MPAEQAVGRPAGQSAGRAPAGQRPNWTSLEALRTLSRTAWSRGQLLREALEPSDAYPRRRSLKRPTAAELRSDYAAARAWAVELFAAQAQAAGTFSLETADVGRTTIGSNSLPAAAVFATAEAEIDFIGKTREAARFRELADGLTGLDPAFRGWAVRRPLQLLGLDCAALTAARVALWLRDNPGSGIYVRQLSLPGVHTKFIENHRRTIDELAVLLAPGASDSPAAPFGSAPPDDLKEDPAGTVDAVLGGGPARTPAGRFADRHGFLHPPELVRFRLLDPAVPLLGGARDVALTAADFSALRLPVQTVIVTENLVNFLALPERPGTLALFGAGYGFSALRDAAWLRDCEVLYWGDLDTHGFRILDQLRAVHPHVASILMDEATLMAHRDAWGSEPGRSRASLTRLTAEETALYRSLGNDDFGSSVRLEQELVRWDWALWKLLP